MKIGDVVRVTNDNCFELHMGFVEKNSPELLRVWQSGKSTKVGDIGIVYFVGKHELGCYAEIDIAVVLFDGVPIVVGTDCLDVLTKKQFSREDLETGMITEYEDGEKRFVMKDIGLFSLDGFIGYLSWEGVGFTNDFTCKIVKVWEPREHNKADAVNSAINFHELNKYKLIYDGEKVLEFESHIKRLKETLRKDERLQMKKAELENEQYDIDEVFDSLNDEWEDIKNKFNSR